MTNKTDTAPQHASTHGCCGSLVSNDKAVPSLAPKPEVAPHSAAKCPEPAEAGGSSVQATATSLSYLATKRAEHSDDH